MNAHATNAHSENTNHCTVYDKCEPIVSVGSAMRESVGESGGLLESKST
jgi:hypothetical protein